MSSSPVHLTVDGVPIEASAGATLEEACARAGVWIPTLCHHPALPGPARSIERVYQGSVEWRGAPDLHEPGCGICEVDVDGGSEPMRACYMRVEPGMALRTRDAAIDERRRAVLARIFSAHPHACLGCRQKRGCAREPCSVGVPPAERCCVKLGNCELERLYDRFGVGGTLPPFERDERRVTRSALFSLDWNLCIGCLRCVRACAGLRQVGALGFVMEDGVVRVGLREPTLEESGCRFCGACAEVCPTGTILDATLPLGDRERHLVPCRAACPAGLDVPGYLRAVAVGRPDEAARIVRDGVPFGQTLGRICHAPCRTACRRSALDEALHNPAIKRYACEAAPLGPPPPRPPATGRCIAVVGAGPAGLAAARWLFRKGHGVTVFEARSEAGGMMRWAIPRYRLPVGVVRREVAEVARDVEIRTSSRIDDVAKLRAQFDAVLVATGLGRSKRLDIPGARSASLIGGLELLGAVATGKTPEVHGDVLVIGGGNVAIDCARTVLRLGARSTTLVCLEGERRMPASPEEVRSAKEEGVRVRCGWGPARITVNDRTSLELHRCVSVFDEAGRFAPVLDHAEKLVLLTDLIVVAIGQEADGGLSTGSDATAGIFTAGDAAGARPWVVDAIASGHAAAEDIDRYLGGDGLPVRSTPVESPSPSPAIGRVDGFVPRPAARIGIASAARATDPFHEVDRVLDAAEARVEAERCLQCDLRLRIGPPPGPPKDEGPLPLDPETVVQVPESEGVLVLFDGGREVLQISGAANLREEVSSYLNHDTVRFFSFERDPYYTKRESEMLQAYLQRHGRLPPGVESLDDLY